MLGAGIGVATLALSGCDVVDGLLGSDDDPGVSGAVTPTAPPADDDSALVEDVLAEISTTGALAVATAAAPGHRAAARLARIHRVHATELGGTVASAAPGAVAPADPQALLTAEATLQQHLVDAARKADSGGLAQVLASMAAALGQALVGRNTPTPAPLPAAAGDTAPAVAALQTTLAAEHAAVFVYGALGGQTSRSGSPALYDAVTSAYVTHRSRRDELTARLHAARAEPVAAEPGYSLPTDLGTPAAVRARAEALEGSVARTYAYLVANTSAEARAWAIDACIDAAVRAVAFGARPDPLPGL